ncbi:MAG TPA: cysteine desulfurase family protein [Thermoanaerobaculia bacterium]|nr:cysteine desulfurase family protein [Thermoanaerobaculia bacterium]
MKPPIYLDYNATTPILPEALDAMLPHLRDGFGNPSSDHAFGHGARAAVDRARERVAAFLGCDPDEVIFTSGGTEANNLAIRGVAEAAGNRRHLVTTAIEHPATANPCAWLGRHGWRVTHAGVDQNGVTRAGDVRSALSPDTALVTVMHSNNETGVLQPVREIAEWAHAAGAIVHTDAAQSIGKVRFTVRELGVDLLSVAGHKVYAPKGVGALYVRRGTSIVPFALGASHERGLRPGTENVASIAGLGAALERIGSDLESSAARMRALRDELWDLLRSRIPGIALNGHPDLRLPNTLSVRFPGVSARPLLERVPQVAASAGSACHAGEDVPSSVITAMGVAPEAAVGSIRLTLGRPTTQQDIHDAADALAMGWAALRV